MIVGQEERVLILDMKTDFLKSDTYHVAPSNYRLVSNPSQHVSQFGEPVLQPILSVCLMLKSRDWGAKGFSHYVKEMYHGYGQDSEDMTHVCTILPTLPPYHSYRQWTLSR